jgi:hypothetical protein
MVLGNSGFTTTKNFSENYLQFQNLSSKLLATSVQGSISSKNISLKGCQIIRLAAASTCFGLALMALLFQISFHMCDVSTVQNVIKFCVNIIVANIKHKHFVNLHRM